MLGNGSATRPSFVLYGAAVEEEAVGQSGDPAAFEQTLKAARPPAAEGLARKLGISAVLQSVAGKPSEPTRLGRLELRDKIGEGAMGVVYRAYDPELDRLVAVKVLQNDAGATERERITREARALAKLTDPHVVTVFDAVTTGNDLYITMELVEGVTLRQWLEAHPAATSRQIVTLFVQAGRGLAAAHRAGLAHRDCGPVTCARHR